MLRFKQRLILILTIPDDGGIAPGKSPMNRGQGRLVRANGFPDKVGMSGRRWCEQAAHSLCFPGVLKKPGGFDISNNLFPLFQRSIFSVFALVSWCKRLSGRALLRGQTALTWIRGASWPGYHPPVWLNSNHRNPDPGYLLPRTGAW
jgi:hypothetical protein